MSSHHNQRGGCAGGRSKGPVGQPARPPGRLPQQDDHRRRGISRRRGRGVDPQGGRAGARRRPDSVAPVHRTHPAAVRSHGNKARGLKARGTASAMITPGEAATIAAELAMPDLDLIKQGEQGCRTGAGGSPGAGRAIPPAPRPPQSARIALARIGSTTHRRNLAADLLQVAGRATIDSIDDCSRPAANGHRGTAVGGLGSSKHPSPPFRGEREGPAEREGEVGGVANRFVGPPQPALSPRPAGGEGIKLCRHCARLLPRGSRPRLAMTAKTGYPVDSRASPGRVGESRCGARDLGLTRQAAKLRGAGPVLGWRAISCRARSSPSWWCARACCAIRPSSSSSPSRSGAVRGFFSTRRSCST
jgi:hypothetical protein